MGNCQAIDNASLVIQHQSGRVERLYAPVTAAQIMKLNPGHFVALLLTTTLYHHSSTATAAAADNNKITTNNNNSLRITRIKLLRPTDTLTLGHAYRLITNQEVMKGLWAKKKMKNGKNNSKETNLEETGGLKAKSIVKEKTSSGTQKPPSDRHHAGSGRNNPRGGWHPSLKSISEA